MRKLLLCVVALGLLVGCATERELPALTAGPLDSTLRAAGLSPRKVKFTGPVTLQVGGTGNTATAKAKAPVASAPHATATAATTKASAPWWLYAGGAALALLVGWLLRGRWP